MGYKAIPNLPPTSVANVAALSDISAPQDGDTRYVQDIDVLYAYTGSAWAPAAASASAPLSPIRGGTGVSNNAAATLTRSGNHALTVTTTATTNVTLPTAGTLLVGPTLIPFTMTPGAVTTPPTKGTATTDIARYWRLGQFLFMRWDLLQSEAGSAGTGTYLFPLPEGLTIDTDEIGVQNTDGTLGTVGWFRTETGSTRLVGNLHVYDSTRLFATAGDHNNAQTIVSPSIVSFASADRAISLVAQWIPIVEWQ